jgi:hypothetical protein
MTENTEATSTEVETPTKGETKPTESKPTIDENAYYAALRVAKKYEKMEAEQKEAKEREKEEAKKRDLANQGKIKELEELYEKKLRDADNRVKLGQHFNYVFLAHGMKELEGVDNIDEKIKEMVEAPEYQSYRLDAAPPKQPQQRQPAGTPPPIAAQTNTSNRNMDELKAAVSKGDREAARELEQRLIDGESL